MSLQGKQVLARLSVAVLGGGLLGYFLGGPPMSILGATVGYLFAIGSNHVT